MLAMMPLAWRVVAFVLVAWLVSAAAFAAVIRYQGSVQSALIISAVISVLAMARVYFMVARPRSNVIAALRDGVQQLKENDFSLTVANSGIADVDELAGAFNSLVETLRRQRLDLHQRELLLDAVVQTTPLALLIVEQSGRVVFANIAARDLFGGKEKYEGMQFRELAERLPQPARKALATPNDGLCTLERDGQPQVWHISKRTFMLNARPHRLVLVKQLTREIAAQELEVWKKVIRLIAHELNNSLGPISSLARSGRALNAAADASGLDQVFTTIESRADHLASFIDAYARFARLPRPRLQTLRWQDFLAPLADALGFSLRVEPPSLTGSFDPSQLEQVLINLVKNAREAGSASEVEMVVSEANRGVSIEVRDRGQGLSEEALRNALLPFYSTKASGSGLGLTLCREIAHAHGGDITVANRPGGGAIVTTWLPRNPGEK